MECAEVHALTPAYCVFFFFDLNGYSMKLWKEPSSEHVLHVYALFSSGLFYFKRQITLGIGN